MKSIRAIRFSFSCAILCCFIAPVLTSGCGAGARSLKKNPPLYLADASDADAAKEGRSDADFLDFGTGEGQSDDAFLDFGVEDTVQKNRHPPPAVADPLEPWNRMMFQVNDKLYFWVMKPVATGYKKIVPEIARRGIKNFFNNLKTPVRFANCVLQGKGEKACHEAGRFLVNTTIGCLGIWDPGESHFKMASSDEDLGQTLAVYGAGKGFYIVWPMIGPSTLMDTLGSGGEYFFDPLNYMEIPYLIEYGGTALEKMNSLSFRIGVYESMKDAAIEPYDAFRDFYIQYREKQTAR